MAAKMAAGHPHVHPPAAATAGGQRNAARADVPCAPLHTARLALDGSLLLAPGVWVAVGQHEAAAEDRVERAGGGERRRQPRRCQRLERIEGAREEVELGVLGCGGRPRGCWRGLGHVKCGLGKPEERARVLEVLQLPPVDWGIPQTGDQGRAVAAFGSASVAGFSPQGLGSMTVALHCTVHFHTFASRQPSLLAARAGRPPSVAAFQSRGALARLGMLQRTLMHGGGGSSFRAVAATRCRLRAALVAPARRLLGLGSSSSAWSGGSSWQRVVAAAAQQRRPAAASALEALAELDGAPPAPAQQQQPPAQQAAAWHAPGSTLRHGAPPPRPRAVDHPHPGIELYLGPMFAGKTTALLRRVAELEARGFNVAIVKSSKDDRYCAASVVTHNGLKRVRAAAGGCCGVLRRAGCKWALAAVLPAGLQGMAPCWVLVSVLVSAAPVRRGAAADAPRGCAVRAAPQPPQPVPPLLL